ncbi:hypothetical protein WJX79_009807 [Trebouxia sp. C0005]
MVSTSPTHGIHNATNGKMGMPGARERLPPWSSRNTCLLFDTHNPGVGPASRVGRTLCSTNGNESLWQSKGQILNQRLSDVVQMEDVVSLTSVQPLEERKAVAACFADIEPCQFTEFLPH